MIIRRFVLLLLCVIAKTRGCYWNGECPYLLHATKTPYDTVRGDIRDYTTPANCEAISIWSLNRHGNRNPGSSTTDSMKEIALLKDDIISSYEAGTSQLCAQDVDLFRKWTWNKTLEKSHLLLTDAGYEELHGIGKRIREKYLHLLQGDPEEYYFRPTESQRTIASGTAFVDGLTEGIALNVSLEKAWKIDHVIKPYDGCERHKREVKRGKVLADQLEAYYRTLEFVKVQNAVQQRLGIKTLLTTDNVYIFYELCRYDRSWTQNLQSPWCAVFTDEDLAVLEYYDDVKRYYRNGYGSWINVKLGAMALKDLYESFEAVVQGNGRKVVSYYLQNTMMEMTLSAMGLYKDDAPLQASAMNRDRKWKTSYMGAFSVNVIAVLNRCQESGDQSHRVQIFINEKVTPVCPLEGCTWQKFQEKFQLFSSANLDFCSMDYVHEVPYQPAHPASNTASISSGFWRSLIK